MIRSGQGLKAIPELEAALKQNPGQTQAAMALVVLYLRTGQTAKAIALAEKITKQLPANAEFLNLLGLVKRQAGKPAEAKAAFEQAVKLDDKLASPRLNLARMEIADRAYDTATARLTAILKVDEKNIEAMAEMAKLSELRNQFPEAQRWLEKAVDSSNIKEARWPLALAEFHLRHGRPSPALEAAKVASSRAPEDLTVLMTLARMQLANKDTASAKSTLTTATRVADYNAPMQVQIALLELAANHPAGAAYSLEKALSGQPDFLPAQALMAETELRMENPTKAEKRARDILEKHPKLAIGHSLLGDIALKRGQVSEAIEDYRRAYQVEPSTDTLLRLYRNLTDLDENASLQLLEQWLTRHPKDVAVKRALAEGQARTGKLTAARKTYEAVLQATPNDAWALNNLANILFKLKDPGAIQVARQAVAKAPSSPQTIDTLGWLLYYQNNIDEALQYLRDARLRSPENAQVRYHLAKVLAETGRKAEAREELEAALKSGGHFEGVEDAKVLMKSLTIKQ
jgi:cellulose synthase operon protein C